MLVTPFTVNQVAGEEDHVEEWNETRKPTRTAPQERHTNIYRVVNLACIPIKAIYKKLSSAAFQCTWIVNISPRQLRKGATFDDAHRYAIATHTKTVFL